ncbi:MAG TPA: GH3 auxin-responsive promoter family protein [Planctomycetota bacterium]|nr:GH3 auxin-responsive promoter family protein [Planctomycetota bacterium]
MSALASILIRILGRASNRRFEQSVRNVRETQEQLLLAMVAANRDTEYGKAHGFASIRSFSDWQRLVPVVTYEDLREGMERVIRGAKNVFTAEDPVLFARTSGTTGDAKYIPVTKTCQGKSSKDQMRTWFHHAVKDHPQIFLGRVLSLVSPAVEGLTPSGLPYGSTSGHIYKNMPSLVRGTYLIPYDLFELNDYEAKYTAIMRLGIGAHVTFLATANPSSIIKMCEMANRHSEMLIKDLHDGTLSSDLPIEGPLRKTLESRLRPDPVRARALSQARQRRAGMLLPVDYWPGLKLIGCWKGGTVGGYLQKFPGWFDPEGQKPIPVRDWGYLSSEARGSIPVTDRGAGGVLTVASNVYEFVPVADLEASPENSSAWNFLRADQVKVGSEYYIFFSTTGGLYRYDINDVVEVTGTYQTAPVIEFRRKGRGMTNITGEKVSVNQIITAFGNVATRLGLTIDHFKAEADTEESRYIFKAESRAGIPESLRPAVLRAIDHELSRLNLEYDAKRKSLRLQDPVLHIMGPGWYDHQKTALVAAGKRLFQAKTELLSPRGREDGQDFLEAIVEWTSE